MTPWARAVRTFNVAIGPVLVAVAVLVTKDGIRNVDVADLVPVALGVIAAAIAGASAYILAASDHAAQTKLGRAVYQFLQVFGSGLGTLVVVDLTGTAAVDFVFAAATFAVLGAVSALQVLVQVDAEAEGGT
jgi:hypothetical protein